MNISKLRRIVGHINDERVLTSLIHTAERRLALVAKREFEKAINAHWNSLDPKVGDPLFDDKEFFGKVLKVRPRARDVLLRRKHENRWVGSRELYRNGVTKEVPPVAFEKLMEQK